MIKVAKAVSMYLYWWLLKTEVVKERILPSTIVMEDFCYTKQSAKSYDDRLLEDFVLAAVENRSRKRKNITVVNNDRKQSAKSFDDRLLHINYG